MRFLVWGAGAIGGTLGAFLARSGHDVTLVDTVAEHVDAIGRAGLAITGPLAAFTVHPPAFTP
ncbi:MAG TPA: 2-dehydropantoate 2-reductase N-terminal domain-containing protein, partial [Gemmatimonadales bacterium]|nr:2-dehydropantoate 2-reductase N-terminal domain-containing protein [Gemmatimonadales bacterium]